MVNEQPSVNASETPIAPELVTGFEVTTGAGAPTGPEQSGQLSPGQVPPGQLPPGYVWAYQPPPEPEKPWKAPRWLKWATVVWVVILVVSGAIYALRGKPTVREQTTIASAQSTVDAAIANVVKAAGPTPIVVVGGFVETSTCDITPVRSGVEYTRVVDLYSAPGTESATLKTIGRGLPSAYAARTGPGNVLQLSADAGDYVGLIGAAPGPGQIEIKAETGCRQAGPAIHSIPAPDPNANEMAPVRGVFIELGVAMGPTSAAQVPCAGGSGVTRTVSARASAAAAGTSLPVSLGPLVPHPVIATPNLMVYRVGAVDLVVQQNSSGVTAWATTRCQ